MRILLVRMPEIEWYFSHVLAVQAKNIFSRLYFSPLRGTRLGRGSGVGRALGDGIGLGDGVGLGVGVGVGVLSDMKGVKTRTVTGDPVLKKLIVALSPIGGLVESNRKLYIVPQRIALALGFCAKVSVFQVIESGA